MRRRLLIGFVLVDAPALLAVAIVGTMYGYVHTYEAIAAWRLAHPWSFAPSIILAAVLIVRWRRRPPASSSSSSGGVEGLHP